MKLSTRALALATIMGTVLQVAMTTLGHSNPAVKGAFAAGGMGISLIAGILYVVISTEVITRDNIVGGAIAGAVCGFIGIFVSWQLLDVPASLLLVGTASSALTGAVGGWIGRLFSSGRV
jgi:hypothetical protein